MMIDIKSFNQNIQRNKIAWEKKEPRADPRKTPIFIFLASNINHESTLFGIYYPENYLKS